MLFVCVQNAGRSQIAAALLDHYAEGRVHVRSAGSAPGDQINPGVVTAMSEIGVDVSKKFPKPMTDEVVQAADAVITMGCGDACPIYPGKRYEDWEVDDPADADLDGVRRIRDDIDQRVRELLAEVAPPVGARPDRFSGVKAAGGESVVLRVPLRILRRYAERGAPHPSTMGPASPPGVATEQGARTCPGPVTRTRRRAAMANAGQAGVSTVGVGDRRACLRCRRNHYRLFQGDRGVSRDHR